MAPMTVECAAATGDGRQAKATQFLDAAAVVAMMADDEADVLDACVTLLVHAGIAAADAICCARLGRHAQGTDHRDAIELLAGVDGSLAKDLGVLLGMKTQAGYSARAMTAEKHRRAVRATTRLVEAARSR